MFSFPLAMTMEMWWLGFYMDRWRLLIFIALSLLILSGVSHFAGFERTSWWSDDILDGFAAFGVGALTSLMLLAVFGVITTDMSMNEVAGKIALQAVPASIGAVLARKQLGSSERDRKDERNRAGYPGQLFLMAVGALFLAFNVAPTEEMLLIAYKMTGWHALVLVMASIFILHAFVYGVGFAGQEAPPKGATWTSTLVHYSVAGYAIAILVSLYVLWTFGRTDDASAVAVAQMVAVLAFPSAVGAAVARLIV
jgi:putative integral membrane protein (TIGR02587 family)